MNVSGTLGEIGAETFPIPPADFLDDPVVPNHGSFYQNSMGAGVVVPIVGVLTQ